MDKISTPVNYLDARFFITSAKATMLVINFMLVRNISFLVMDRYTMQLQYFELTCNLDAIRNKLFRAGISDQG